MFTKNVIISSFYQYHIPITLLLEFMFIQIHLKSVYLYANFNGLQTITLTSMQMVFGFNIPYKAGQIIWATYTL